MAEAADIARQAASGRLAKVRGAVTQAPGWARIVALGALAVLALVAILAPVALAAGWLAVWVFALSITTGAGVWFLIWTLTGGGWIEPGRAHLARLSAATPWVAAAGVLFVVTGPALYPWWDGSEGLRAEIYLNPAAFGIRAVVILGLWSAIGILAPRGLSKLAAALLLTVYGIVVNFAGLDWILSRDPDFLSTTFGGLLAIFQLGIALAAGALLRLSDEGGRGPGDWGGLMLACVLGVFYLASMQFLVSWSGNLPFKAAWYLARQDGAATLLMIASVLLGAVLPFAVLIVTRRRGDTTWLRRAGALMLAGAYLNLVWMAAPGHMVAAALVGLALPVVVVAAAMAWRAGGRNA